MELDPQGTGSRGPASGGIKSSVRVYIDMEVLSYGPRYERDENILLGMFLDA